MRALDERGLAEVEEGAARLLVPAEHRRKGPGSRARAGQAFYNRAAAQSRDVSVLYMAARHGGSGIRALDALAGTGARGIRWLLEAGLEAVTLNDKSPAAAELVRRNLALNGLGAEVTQRDAAALLAERGFQHVDLDPYGSPAPFLAAAFASLGREGGVSLTATDSAALAGASPRACVRRYAAGPTRSDDLCHEAGLRILLGAAVREAAKHDQGAVPVLGNHRDHYFRCHLEARRSARLADAQLARLAWLLECRRCLHRALAPEPERACPACGAALRASGPMWGGPLWEPGLLAAMEKAREGRRLAEPREAARDLALWASEAAAGGLPFSVHAIAERERIPEAPPAEAVLARLAEMGHRASRCHLGGTLVRTPAPAADVVRAVREAAERRGR